MARHLIATLCWLASITRKPTVYPELIRPGDWTIEEWRPGTPGAPCPCTDNAGHRMWVPFGKGKFAREVRFHELCHARWSPESVPEIPGVTHDSIVSAEEYRVNAKGSLIRPHDALGATPGMPDPFQLATSKTERGAAQLAASCLGYVSSDAYLNKLDTGLRDLVSMASLPVWLRTHARILRRAIECVRDNIDDVLGDADEAEFDDTIRLARWLDDNFEDDAPGPKQDGSGNPDDEDGEYDEEADSEGGSAEDAVWGEMHIETPPLTHRSRNAPSRRTTPSVKGRHIRHLNRMVTGAIFGREKQAGRPDAVLIDDSGSMHWDEEKFYKLVESLPVGVIAAYSGDGGTGVLRILAKDGRMVAPDLISTPYGGNEVDGPALRWLAKQPGRRVWVSDQGVCSSQGSAADLKADCDAIVKGNGIRTCLTTDPAEILRVLRGK